jgi:hypothetical protein
VQVAAISDGGVNKCVVMRYGPDGKLDGDFGQTGTSVLPIPDCVSRRVHVQPDGRIVIGGQLIVRVWN